MVSAPNGGRRQILKDGCAARRNELTLNLASNKSKSRARSGPEHPGDARLCRWKSRERRFRNGCAHAPCRRGPDGQRCRCKQPGRLRYCDANETDIGDIDDILCGFVVHCRTRPRWRGFAERCRVNCGGKRRLRQTLCELPRRSTARPGELAHSQSRRNAASPAPRSNGTHMASRGLAIV